MKITVWLGTQKIFILSTEREMSGAQLAELKKSVLNCISIVSGAIPSTLDVLNQTIDQLFTYIVSFRGGDFIEGEFLQSPELEARLSSLEVRVESMEKLLEELQHIWKVRGPQP